MAIYNMVGGGSSGGSGLPTFTYTGTYSLSEESDGWKLKLLSSGTLVFSEFGKGSGSIDCFAVGGGGGAGCYTNTAAGGYSTGGGGGGYTTLESGIVFAVDTNYAVTIGDGGTYSGNSGGSATGGTGGASSIIGSGVSVTATGGGGGTAVNATATGGSGGSGGNKSTAQGSIGVSSVGGTDGSSPSGVGMGTYEETGIYYVREFRESTGTVYSDGGGSQLSSAVANSGNGGRSNTITASSGIIVLRNHRSA